MSSKLRNEVQRLKAMYKRPERMAESEKQPRKRGLHNKNLGKRKYSDEKDLRASQLEKDESKAGDLRLLESEIALAKKAKLYEQLQSNHNAKNKDMLLVDFAAKESTDAPLIESTDEFGRTVLKSQEQIDASKAKTRLQTLAGLADVSISSSDSSSESDEGQIDVKSHLQNIATSLTARASIQSVKRPFLDDRSLGAAHFEFSTDTQSKAAQRLELEQLHSATVEKRTSKTEFKKLLGKIKTNKLAS